VIDDTFYKNFMEDDPAARAPDGMADKPTYTRAEVDEIIQQTIKSTMEALQGQTNNDTPESQAETEEEENENGSNEESSSDTGETE
jgi:hypothetical protein